VALKNPDNKTIAWIKAGVFLLALVPLVKLGVRGYFDLLGANPIEKITRTTGYWTLVMLMITLAATPLRRILGWAWLIRLRRMLGLFAFFYGTLHFLTYVVLDQFFDWPSIVKDIVKRPYITVGFPSFLLMIPLALTSTDRITRWLGGKRWRMLHRLVYLIAVGGVVHFWWLVKKDITELATFAAVLAILLGVRLFYRLRRFIQEKLMARAALL